MSCRYADGRQEPEIVLAIGQNLFFEFMVAVAGAAGSLLGGLVLTSVSLLAAALITVVLFVQGARRSYPAAAPGWDRSSWPAPAAVGTAGSGENEIGY